MTNYYKAFNKDWTCRNFQYEVGKSYTHDGEINLCTSGFHVCENPFDCWSYYDVTDSKFALVTVGDEIKNGGDDSKSASAEITIKTELNLPDFIDAGVDYLVNLTNKNKGSSGNYAKIGSSGNYAQIGSSGKDTVIASAGIDAKAKGAKGTWLSLAEYSDGECVGFAVGCIGKKNLKPDTYYIAKGGKLVEYEE